MWQPPSKPPAGQKQRRNAARKALNTPAVLHYKGTQIPVVLKDISKGGTRVALNPHRAQSALDGPLQLDIPGLVKLPVDIKWRKEGEFGVAFDTPQHRQAMLNMQIQRLMGPGR